jgi:hypothetical protein
MMNTNLFSKFLYVVIGFLAGLLFTERQRRQQAESEARVAREVLMARLRTTPDPTPVPATSRTPEEISPTYANRKPLSDYDEEEALTYIDTVSRELVQPGLNELEAYRVAEILSQLTRAALSYDERRQTQAEVARLYRAEKWAEEAEEGAFPVSQRSRTPEEISPTYANRRKQLIDYTDDEVAGYIHAVVREMVQPGITELEAERIGETLSQLARDALTHGDERNMRLGLERQLRADRWMDEIEEEIDDE